MNVPSERYSILGLDLVRGPRESHARLRHKQLQYAPQLSSTPDKVSSKSAKTLSWRTICTPSRRDDSRGHIRKPQSLSLSNPLWNDLDFVPVRVKPRSTCSRYPTISPPPSPNFTIFGLLLEGFSNYKNKTSARSLLLFPKVFHAAADFSPNFAYLCS